MIKMKKAISLLLALAMCCSLCVTAFATDEPVDSTGSVVGDLGATGENIVGKDPNLDVTSTYDEYSNAGNQDVEVL